MRIEENENIVELTGEDGSVTKLEFLDLIGFDGSEYAVFIEPGENSDEVIILRVDNFGDEEDQTFSDVDDENIVNAVFGIFKDRNSDIFDFE